MAKFGATFHLRSFGLAAFVSVLAVTGAAAQNAKEAISAKTLNTLKTLAWQSLPSKIVMADKRVVEINKTDPSQIIIPDEDAARIIKLAHVTARAHKCDLQELVIANRDAIIASEKASGKWSESQLHYINTLHLYTVQLLVGKVEVVEDDKLGKQDGKAAPAPAIQCSDSEKKEILAAVEANEKAAKKS